MFFEFFNVSDWSTGFMKTEHISKRKGKQTISAENLLLGSHQVNLKILIHFQPQWLGRQVVFVFYFSFCVTLQNMIKQKY
jgi:hypothetical protein